MLGPLARKVLADAKRAMEERKRISERLQGSEKFVPASTGKWPEPSDKVGNIAPGSGQSAPLRGGNSGDLIANAVAGDEIGITDGRADLTTLDLVHCVNPESTARPSSGSALGTDRAATRSGRFG